MKHLRKTRGGGRGPVIVKPGLSNEAKLAPGVRRRIFTPSKHLHQASEAKPRIPRIPPYCMLFLRASSNSSPGTHPASVGDQAAFEPSTKPNLAITASPVKSISGWYSSLGW